MGNLTISMVIFHSYVELPEGMRFVHGMRQKQFHNHQSSAFFGGIYEALPMVVISCHGFTHRFHQTWRAGKRTIEIGDFPS